MQRIERQPAYILHERPYRETSVLLEVLTRDHGRVGLVARGVRSAKPRFARGTVKPLQALELSWMGRGELGNLAGADPVGVPVPLAGDGLLCALYLNELLARLLARNDPHPEVFARYAAVLYELAAAGEAAAQAWALRRFERDLLAGLGYALPLDEDEAGGVLEPGAQYALDPERGALRWSGGGPAPLLVSGAALRALAAEDPPGIEVLRELKRALRAVLRHHLGGRELGAWSIRPPASGPLSD